VNKKPVIAALAFSLVIVLAAGIYLGLGARPQLGLDLQGGISAVYTAELPDDVDTPEDFEEILDETIEVIRARVDSLGVAEPDISRSGTDVLVQLPGVADADRLQELIGTTAQLTFRKVIATVPPGAEPQPATDDVPAIPGYDEGPDCTAAIDERPELGNDERGLMCGSEDEALPDPDSGELLVPKYFVEPAALTGDRIDDAFAAFGQAGGLAVSLDLDSEGAAEFAAITAELACERDQGFPGQGRFAITLDGIVESAPTMAPGVQCGVGIRDGSASITVGAAGSQQEQEQEAQDLALILRTGALPITLEPATFETVSATLGADSLQAGLLAGLIGLALVGVWLIGFYRILGVVAMLELVVFGVIVMALISLLGQVGFALTLAGVAGLIVSIGIAADSSIIFRERIRDEVNLGKTVRTAVQKAFTSAFRTNLAGNTVTLTAAVILYFLAVGPVRGFALMLGIATLLDLFILYFFTRPIVFLLANTKLLDRKTVRAADTAPVATAGGRR
jgi:preprotein translocase subunit SecD